MAFKPNSNWQLWFSAQCFLSSQIICRLWVCRLAKYSGNFSMMDYPMLSHTLMVKGICCHFGKCTYWLFVRSHSHLQHLARICSLLDSLLDVWQLMFSIVNILFQSHILCAHKNTNTRYSMLLQSLLRKDSHYLYDCKSSHWRKALSHFKHYIIHYITNAVHVLNGQ